MQEATAQFHIQLEGSVKVQIQRQTETKKVKRKAGSESSNKESERTFVGQSYACPKHLGAPYAPLSLNDTIGVNMSANKFRGRSEREERD